MNNWTIKLLILSMILGWTTTTAAESHSSDPAEALLPEFEFANPPTTIDRAGIPQKLLWAAITVINLKDEYKLIPLYGYPISDLDEESQLQELIEAAAGNVNVAILCPPSGAENAQGNDAEPVYTGQGLRISGNKSEVENPARLREPWKDFRDHEISALCDDALIALTRPLPDTASSNSRMSDENPLEFVTWSNLW